MTRLFELLIAATSFNGFSSGPFSWTSSSPQHALQYEGIEDHGYGPHGIHREEWHALNRSISGRLIPVARFAAPCYEGAFDSPACLAVRRTYLDGLARTNHPAAYVQPQWETCQRTDDHWCLLDASDPDNTAPLQRKHNGTRAQCPQGSVSSYVIDVRDPEDVRSAFAFSRRTKVPLNIRNTGHDYKGRSSAPGSLGVWTHNLKKISYNERFIPDGCSPSEKIKPRAGVTMEAGVQWGEAYAFAEANNITIVGGTDKAVGAVGGWLQGGGHGGLSNTYGLGVDRVMQFKVVTPDGKLRVANECQNTDLFWALRGGGGGTFGVVLSATMLASPSTKIQTVIFTLPSARTLGSRKGHPAHTKALFSVLANNAVKWAEDGWGGYAVANAVILINPVLTPEEARKSARELIEFGERLNAEDGQGLAEDTVPTKLIVTEFPSYTAWFTAFSKDFFASVGRPLAMASRLIPKDSFATRAKQEELVDALLDANAAAPGLIILMTAPASVPSTGPSSSKFVSKDIPVKGGSSVTEAWRKSLWHTTVVSPWNWDASREEVKGHYVKASGAVEPLRRITPNAAYVNEADVYEPDWQNTFWGGNYERLLEIKRKYDPERLLDCWHCVGWRPESHRFKCYL